MEDHAASNRQALVCLAGLLAGLLVTLAGLAWMVLAKPSHVWSPEQAAELKAAGDALHAARSRDPGEAQQGQQATPQAAGDASQAPPALAAAQARFDRIDAELESARTGRQRTGTWLLRLGLAAMVLFGVGYLSTRER
jgi:hypothetical protein